MTRAVSQEIIHWIQPLPRVEPLILGKNPITITYMMANNSNKWVEIKALGLEGSEDPRVQITGGTCKRGLHLEAGKFCTIEITINPLAIGMLQQVLYVQHSGMDSPLWIEIVTVVTVEPIGREIKSSFLIKESLEMENNRRLIEQAGHRQFAKVNARDRTSYNASPDQGLEQNSQMKQHPYFAQNQRYDGIENNISPNPANNPAAQDKYQEIKEEQDLAKQLRLGKQPEFINTLKPKLRPYG